MKCVQVVIKNLFARRVLKVKPFTIELQLPQKHERNAVKNKDVLECQSIDLPQCSFTVNQRCLGDLLYSMITQNRLRRCQIKKIASVIMKNAALHLTNTVQCTYLKLSWLKIL
jgi:hypothetical protein